MRRVFREAHPPGGFDGGKDTTTVLVSLQDWRFRLAQALATSFLPARPVIAMLDGKSCPDITSCTAFNLSVMGGMRLDDCLFFIGRRSVGLEQRFQN